jgi:hypothetical protein
MSSVVDQLFARLAELPEAQREELAETFLEQLPGDDEAEWDPEYVAEIERRVAKVEAGTATLIDFDDVLARLERKR